MKKIGLLILTIVLALGTIGVGYAMWSDDVMVTGTVQTGSLDLTVLGYSGTEVYKIVATGEAVTLHWRDTGSGRVYVDKDGYIVDPPVAPNFLVASAGAAFDDDPSGDYGHEVVMTFDKLFPCIDFAADLAMKYTGTIPAHVRISPVWYGTTDLIGYTTWQLYVNGVLYVQGDCLQLHENDLLKLVVTCHISQTEEDPNLDMMDVSDSFSILIEAIQWNELPCPELDS